jgi:FixJ family two-component response regulator
MGQKCTVCAHPEVHEINKALLSGQSNLSVAAKYDLSVTSVRRHKAAHISEHLTKAKEAEQVTKADDLISDLQFLKAKALTFLAK